MIARLDPFPYLLILRTVLSTRVLSYFKNGSRFPLLGNHDGSPGRLHLCQDLSGMVAEICHRTNIFSWSESHIEYLLKYLSKYFSRSMLCRQAGKATGCTEGGSLPIPSCYDSSGSVHWTMPMRVTGED